MKLNLKIVAALERIAEVYKSLLWEKAKKNGISPIQIQIVLFIANHNSNLCNVSALAKEFNVTKPTISDAVKVLYNKQFLEKDFSQEDNRSHSLFLTALGKELVADIVNFSDPLSKEVGNIDFEAQRQLFSTLSQLIYRLNVTGILEVQRTCFGCYFYEKHNNEEHYCNLIQSKLKSEDIRIDCPEYKKR